MPGYLDMYTPFYETPGPKYHFSVPSPEYGMILEGCGLLTRSGRWISDGHPVNLPSETCVFAHVSPSSPVNILPSHTRVETRRGIFLCAASIGCATVWNATFLQPQCRTEHDVPFACCPQSLECASSSRPWMIPRLQRLRLRYR